LVDGVELEDGTASATSARLVDHSDGKGLVEITMLEGRNREVRRMFAAVDYEVLRLVRTAIGSITDQQLRAGESRRLEVLEIQRLLASGTN
jgi:23S rRNA pseudouridine2605 synthase